MVVFWVFAPRNILIALFACYAFRFMAINAIAASARSKVDSMNNIKLAEQIICKFIQSTYVCVDHL
jgi:hypothetical protein